MIYFQTSNIKIYYGDAFKLLKAMPSESVNCCITSPPYYGMRDYGTANWVGGIKDCPHMRTTKIGKKTQTGHKAMHENGHVVGDAIYKSECPKCGAVRVDKQIGLEETPEKYVDNLVEIFREVKRILKYDATLWLNLGDSYNGIGIKDAKFKPKDLLGIPWRVAFALQADGWYLRQDIIWHKPNPMPENIKDRCTKSHEYMFLLTKSKKYYFDHDAIKEPCVQANKNVKRNKRSVWMISVKPFKKAHFATFPEKLIEPCILAGSKTGDTILDPFIGSGTTALVAHRYGRKAIGCELNPAYINIAKERLNNLKP